MTLNELVKLTTFWTTGPRRLSLLNKSFGTASTQSDQGLHYQLTESLDITECINGEQKAGWYFAHVQDDLNLHIMRMFEDRFPLAWPT